MNLTLTDTLEFSYEYKPKSTEGFDENSFAYILLYNINGPIQLWQSEAFSDGKFQFEIPWEAVAASNVVHGSSYTLYTQKSPNSIETRLFGDSGKFVWR